jgi:hypothetical protein
MDSYKKSPTSQQFVSTAYTKNQLLPYFQYITNAKSNQLFFYYFYITIYKNTSVVQINTEINFEVLGTFFYRKKKALLPLAKASLSACRPLCRCVGSKPPKKLLYEDKTLGRCPKPYPPFEK